MSNAPVSVRSGIIDCWNGIGVRGDASCPDLVRHVHCRNCPVYARAAVDLLDIDLPAGYLAQSTRDIAGDKPQAFASTLSVVIFRIGAEWLALPTAVIGQITSLRPIHSLPHRRDGVLGLANVQGRLLVCLSLRQILQLDDSLSPEPTRESAGGRMLVTLQDGSATVYPVDEVHGVQRFTPEALVVVSTAVPSHIKAVVAWHARSVSLIEPQLLSSTVKRSLASPTAI